MLPMTRGSFLRLSTLPSLPARLEVRSSALTTPRQGLRAFQFHLPFHTSIPPILLRLAALDSIVELFTV